MERIKLNLAKFEKSGIDYIVNFLNRGKVIVYPTDTIYGIGCRADNKKAISRIYKIKKREKKKPLLILVSSMAMAKKYCRINKEQVLYLKKAWPGPVSVVCLSRQKLPVELTGGLATQAVRLPKNNFLIRIVKKIGMPLVSTSLNLSGEPPILELKNIEKILNKEKPDLIIDAGRLKNKASKIIDIRDINKVKVLRK